ncbi:MAG: histidine kinase [Treponema sp.]|jgi:two-component system sensor histidine kinase YesM|nr:histidine kinase [Treponema sp.]
MKGTIFSRRLVLIYTLIVAIPLGFLIFFATEILRRSEYQKVVERADKRLEDYARHVLDCLEVVNRIRNTITNHTALADYFLFTSRDDKVSVILQTRTLADELERMQLSFPLLYAIRVFFDDQRLPERWPAFYHENRLDHPATGWQFNYRGGLITALEDRSPPMVSYTGDLFLRTRRIGILQIAIPVDNFFPFINSASPETDFVLTRNQVIPESIEPSLAGRIRKAAESGESGSVVLKDKGKNRLFLWRAVPDSELLLVHDCYDDSVLSGLESFRLLAGFGIFASTMLLFFTIRFATGRLMRRLYVIMEGMRELRRGNLDIALRIEGNDEVTEMARVFTDMAGRIKGLAGEITREQQLVAQTEIRAMQNQINAHFLYNVLETVKMQAEIYNADGIVCSITLLGRMLRYCLGLRLRVVPLREELGYIRSYIDLLNIRNDYTIDLCEKIEEPYLDNKIPKMLIQPLVENAFLHAVEPMGEDARIDITAEVENGVLWISVKDYGPGLETGELEKIKERMQAEETGSGHIGLRNIQQRLSVFYGETWKLRIVSVPGEGTVVHIPIPLTGTVERPCP